MYVYLKNDLVLKLIENSIKRRNSLVGGFIILIEQPTGSKLSKQATKNASYRWSKLAFISCDHTQCRFDN